MPDGLEALTLTLKTLSTHLRTNLLANGWFITALPRSVLWLYAHRSLPTRSWPVAIGGLVCTRIPNPHVRERALAEGAIAFLRKPYQDSVLANCVEVALRQLVDQQEHETGSIHARRAAG